MGDNKSLYYNSLASGLYPGTAHFSVKNSKATGVAMTPDGKVVYQTEKHIGGGQYEIVTHDGKPISKGLEDFLRKKYDVFAEKPVSYETLCHPKKSLLQQSAADLTAKADDFLTRNSISTYDLTAESQVFSETTVSDKPAFTMQHDMV